MTPYILFFTLFCVTLFCGYRLGRLSARVPKTTPMQRALSASWASSARRNRMLGMVEGWVLAHHVRADDAPKNIQLN